MKTIEDYEDESRQNIQCKKCNSIFKFKPDDIFWNEKGYGYSTKLVRCSECGCANVLGYVEDYGFSKLNTDRRLYFKKK